MKAPVKSFESGNRKAGDLLSVKAEPGRLKVGLLTCGYFEYWRMYPETLKKKVEQDMRKVTARFSRDFNVVCPGLVDTLDAADRAGRIFKKEQVDMLIVVEGTYIPDYLSLHAIDYVREAPLLLFSTQSGDSIDPGSDYEETLRNSGLIGIAQLTGTLAKMGRKYRAVVGSIDDPHAYAEIAAYGAALRVVDRLRRTDIGLIGHTFRGMYDLEQDKTKIKGGLGPNIIYIQTSHLLDLVEKVPDAEPGALAAKLKKKYRMQTITDDDLARSCRVALAMKRLVKKFRLNALCFLGQHYLQTKTGASPRLGASLLLEENEHMVISEGDLAGLIMMIIFRELTGASPFFAEWGEYDLKKNAVLFMGHGIGSPALAGSSREVRLTGTPEEWGFRGNGTNYEFTLKPGPVTIGHFLDTRDGWRMLISRGTALDFPRIPCEELTAVVQVEKPVKTYLSQVLARGVAHHVVLTYGDVTRELEQICDILNIEKFIV